jgi:hypothetical protein
MRYNKKPRSPQDLGEQLQLIKEVRATFDTLLESSASLSLEVRILK